MCIFEWRLFKTLISISFTVTDSVEFFQCNLPDGQEFYMIDTPGFDDSFKSDAQILQILADRLNEAYENGIMLSGIIHLHRIMDNKVGGQALKDMRMFRKLCGDSNLESVVLATTRWAEVELPVAAMREAELKSRPDFWKPLIDLGASVFRQDQGRESATRIVQHLIDKKHPMVPEISVDMVDRGKKLGDTAAGQEVVSQVERIKKFYETKLEEIREAIKETLATRNKEDQEELEILREAMEEYEENKRLQDEALEKMQADSERLRREMNDQYEAENAELMEQLRATTELLKEEERLLEAVKEEGHKKDLALKAVMLKNKQYKRALTRPCLVM